MLKLKATAFAIAFIWASPSVAFDFIYLDSASQYVGTVAINSMLDNATPCTEEEIANEEIAEADSVEDACDGDAEEAQKPDTD